MLSDKMLRAAFAVLFEKHGWERDAGAEAEVREALEAALEAGEQERHGRIATAQARRLKWSRLAERAARGQAGEG